MAQVTTPSDPAEVRRQIPFPQRSTASLPAANAASEPTLRRWRAFALLVVAYFMTIVDLTIVTVALPTIGIKLHFPESDLQWVVTAYSLTFGGFLLLGGRAADLLGRRRLLMVGLAVFSAASLACGLANSDTFLIVMRGIQGLGAAIVLPAALSIVMNIFPEGSERNKALGIWGAMGATGATVGLLAGGVLTRYVGWQAIFFLNVPIGAAALVLGAEGRARKQGERTAASLRPIRSSLHYLGPGGARLCHLAGATRGLGHDADHRHARDGSRPTRRLPGHRDSS